jgi:hypothetical protein
MQELTGDYARNGTCYCYLSLRSCFRTLLI